MPSLTITHADASTDQIDQTVTTSAHPGYVWTRELGAMDKLVIQVERSAAKAAGLEIKSDEVELSGVTTARLVDIDKGGATWRLICYGFDWDANRHPPTDGGVLRTQTDAEHMDQFINSVSEWSIGTTNAQTGDVTYIFNDALAHEGMRRVERNSPGELRFNADKSVDYLDRVGADKSGSITLSAANNNIEGDLQVKSRGRSIDATHVRLLGAHEGEAQLRTNLVPSADSGNFTNEVTYTQPRWSNSTDTDWARRVNKDLASQSAINEAANSLAEELVDTHTEVKGTVVGENLVLGDTVRVTKTEADIDRDMRIRKIITRLNDATERDEVHLSTRNKIEDSHTERMRDIKRYNVAFQGSAVWGTLSGGYQAITSSSNYQVGAFDYPNIDFEHDATLWVKGVPYRTYSSGAAAGGDHTHTVEVNHPTHDHNIGITSDNVPNASFSQVYSNANTTTGADSPVTLDSHTITTEGWPYIFQARVHTASGNASSYGTIELTLLDGNDNNIADITPTLGNNFANIMTGADQTAIVTQDLNNTTVQLDLGWSAGDSEDWVWAWDIRAVPKHNHGISGTSDTALGTTISETSDASGDHTHAPNPGVTEFGGTTVSNVDVLVDGNTVASNIGSGTFETTVDITGDLTPGQFNNVELSTDSTGGMFATLSIDAYRQIGTQ